MPNKPRKHLWDAYRFPGFYPQHTVTGVFGDPKARVIHLSRRLKKPLAARVGRCTGGGMTRRPGGCGISAVATTGSTWSSMSAGWTAGGAER